jgi:hypothetical protein
VLSLHLQISVLHVQWNTDMEFICQDQIREPCFFYLDKNFTGDGIIRRYVRALEAYVPAQCPNLKAQHQITSTYSIYWKNL